jgi:LPPG:FO 2-phospho-L-lactate transferase
MTGSVLALCGGIGGAKLALGLSRSLGAGEFTVLVNTGDDFEHLGLKISPDIDTVLYTLAGLSDPERGWGRADETWNFMSAIREIGGDTWFQLGDRDLAMHVERTKYLRAGGLLTDFVEGVAHRLGLHTRILPMTDEEVRTIVETDDDTLEFQRYFVEQRCRPRVRSLWFAGACRTRVSATVSRAIFDASRAIIICPSNPYLSIDPILSIPGMRAALHQATAPIIAVSPIIGGQAVKGPTAKIMSELGLPVTNVAIAEHYRGLIDGLIVDESDADDAAAIDVPVHVAHTLMQDLADRVLLANEALAFAETLAMSRPAGMALRHATAGVYA